MKISNTNYLAKGRLERFNKKGIFLYNVREVIRKSHLLDEKGEYSYKKFREMIPHKNWRYDPFEYIRITALINPKDYVIIQDILEEETDKLWEFDKFIKALIKKFIQRHTIKSTKQDTRDLKKFEIRFKKYYRNIMGSWRE